VPLISGLNFQFPTIHALAGKASIGVPDKTAACFLPRLGATKPNRSSILRSYQNRSRTKVDFSG
jgi:hypothetical protein